MRLLTKVYRLEVHVDHRTVNAYLKNCNSYNRFICVIHVYETAYRISSNMTKSPVLKLDLLDEMLIKYDNRFVDRLIKGQVDASRLLERLNISIQVPSNTGLCIKRSLLKTRKLKNLTYPLTQT